VLDCDFVEGAKCYDRDCDSMHLTYFWEVKKEDLVFNAQISYLVRSSNLWLSAHE
jgi:hypothetical protein